MNQRQADLFHKLCDDPSVCNANAYFYAMDGTGTPAIDWMCRKDYEENGVCWCGKLDAALIVGTGCAKSLEVEGPVDASAGVCVPDEKSAEVGP